jgi:superfamily II DNA or RNA helicase
VREPGCRAYGGSQTIDMSQASLTASVPKSGELVRVRDRHWLVVDVRASALPSGGSGLSATGDHLVTLSSVDDDGLNDELRVFWRLEGDARILERATLPTPQRDRLDDPEELHAFLDAVRWGAIASADAKALQAPFRSGITIEDYQLDPVVRALDMPRVNLLVADDVGLGKTIEAGLVVQELLLRHRARTVLVLCPPALRFKWRREMLEKFGLAFEVIDADKLRELRRRRGVGADPFKHFPRAIVSFDWLKDGRPLELVRATLDSDPNHYPRRFDLLIVDEVHQCAPSGNGAYAVDSKRTKLLEMLAPQVEHRLFLSATPHNGYASSYSALLAMLDPQRFARGVPPDEAALSRAVVRRMKAQIDEDLGPKPDGSVRFPRREVIAIPVEYGEAERMAHADLAAYTALRRKRSHSEKGREGAAGEACDLILLLLKKRLFSSPNAFATTLAAHLRTLTAPRPASRPDVERLRAAYDETDDDFALDDDLEDATEEALLVAARASEAVTEEEQALLDRLRSWSSRAATRADAKADELVARLRAWCLRTTASGKTAWADERIIIFTEYRATQTWLERIIRENGLAGDRGERLALLYGGMLDEDRQRIVNEFGADPAARPVRILLATDTASEGIDLQQHCRRMIHVEIPFNPNRLEQRNGRIDRHGQPSPTVEIYHFVGSTATPVPGSLEADLEFLSRAARKVEQIRADLGDAGVVLAREVENALLGRPADIDRAVPSRSGRATVRRLERDLRERIAELRARIDASITELGITPEALARAVGLGLRLGHQAALRPVTLAPRAFAVAGQAFEVPELTRSWASAAADLYDDIHERRRPITFDAAVSEHRDDVVHAHLGHPLVAQALRLLRAEMWSAASEARLSRVTGSLVGDADLAEPTLIVHARLVVVGRDGVRLHEELFAASGRLTSRGFARRNVGETQRAAAARRVGPLPRHHHLALVDVWPRIADAVSQAVDARAGDREESLRRLFEDRAESEAKALRAVLAELAKSIERELQRVERNDAEQLRLFPDAREAERGQLARDVEGLRRRVDSIPEEAEREAERLRSRYDEPRAIIFPAAVELLVPLRLRGSSLE